MKMIRRFIIGLSTLATTLLVAAPALAVSNDAILPLGVNNRFTLTPGEYIITYYDFLNQGTQLPPLGSGWTARVGTSEPRDRSSAFYISPSDGVLGSWVSANRIANISTTGAGSYNFGTNFYMAAPSTLPSNLALGKTYREYVEFVMDNGGSWLPSSKAYYDITLDSKHGQWIGQSGYPTIPRGSAVDMFIQFKNTGPTGWYRNGMRGYTGTSQYPVGAVRLGTANPLDRGSLFWATGTTGWVSNNRIQLQESYVAAGDIGTFRFTLTPHASLTAGSYKEYFRLVCEGVGWMEDSGVNVVITVT